MCLNRGRGETRRGGNDDEILMNIILVLYIVGGEGSSYNKNKKIFNFFLYDFNLYLYFKN